MTEHLELFIYVPFIFLITLWLFKFYRTCYLYNLPDWKIVFAVFIFLFITSLLDISDQFPEPQYQLGLKINIENFRYISKIIHQSWVFFLLLMVYRWTSSLASKFELTKETAVNEKRLRASLNSSLNAMIKIKHLQSGTNQTVNLAGTKIFDFQSEGMLEKNTNILTPNLYKGEHDQHLKNHNETHDVHILGRGKEMEGKHSDGSAFPINLAVRDSTCQGNKFLDTIRDTAVLKCAEQSLISELKEANDG